MKKIFGLLALTAMMVSLSACERPADISMDQLKVDANGCWTLKSYPQHLEVVERVTPIGETYQIQSEGKVYGAIKLQVMKFAKTYTLSVGGYDVAVARQRMASWGTQIEVYNCKGQKIGEIRENILKSLFRNYTEYAVADMSTKKVARSQKIELLATDFELTENGQLVSSLHRPMINLITDKWSMDLANSEKIDPRIMVFVPAYKTSADNDRKSDDDDSSRRRKN